jgi:hypothetical protein
VGRGKRFEWAMQVERKLKRETIDAGGAEVQG